MAAFYLDENFPFPVALASRDLGHDVLTAFDAGNAGNAGGWVADSEVLAFATSAGRTVLTSNRHDFIRLHLQNPDHAGIVVGTEDSDAAGQASRIADAVHDHESLRRQLIRVNRPQR